MGDSKWTETESGNRHLVAALSCEFYCCHWLCGGESSYWGPEQGNHGRGSWMSNSDDTEIDWRITKRSRHSFSNFELMCYLCSLCNKHSVRWWRWRSPELLWSSCAVGWTFHACHWLKCIQWKTCVRLRACDADNQQFKWGGIPVGGSNKPEDVSWRHGWATHPDLSWFSSDVVVLEFCRLFTFPSPSDQQAKQPEMWSCHLTLFGQTCIEECVISPHDTKIASFTYAWLCVHLTFNGSSWQTHVNSFDRATVTLPPLQFLSHQDNNHHHHHFSPVCPDSLWEIWSF